MEIHFSAEQEAQLSQIAAHFSVDTEVLVKDAALRMLDQTAHFQTAVQEGIAAADRGDFIGHEQVWKSVEEILNGR